MARTQILNFGPAHPASHGVLRLELELDGETILGVKPHIGYLHRGTEKLMEARTYHQGIPFLDRLGYISCLPNEHAYVLAVEKLLGIEAPLRAQYIRIMLDELTRIFNHLLWLGTNAMDVGAMNVFLYAMKAREDIYDVFEAITGARMHGNYYRPGGVAKDLPQVMPQFSTAKIRSFKKAEKLNLMRKGSVLDFIMSFCAKFPEQLKEFESILTENRVFKERTVGIGAISKEEAITFGFSGPMLRASGVIWDLRKTQPYAIYDKLDFLIPTGKTGDCYDRFLVRMAEMAESLKLVKQTASWLAKNPGVVMLEIAAISPPAKSCVQSDAKAKSEHYQFFAKGYAISPGRAYAAVEHPLGEFGVFIVADGNEKPYRVKLRSVGMPHLAAINKMLKGHTLGDVPVVIASLDIIMGDIDK